MPHFQQGRGSPLVHPSPASQGDEPTEALRVPSPKCVQDGSVSPSHAAGDRQRESPPTPTRRPGSAASAWSRAETDGHLPAAGRPRSGGEATRAIIEVRSPTEMRHERIFAASLPKLRKRNVLPSYSRYRAVNGSVVPSIITSYITVLL